MTVAPIGTLAMLIGPMLDPGVRVVDASGEGLDRGEPLSERYVQDGTSRALASSSGVFIAESGGRSRTVVHRVERDRGPARRGPLGHTDALLRPIALPIWGRRDDDYRLGEVVGWSDEFPGCVVVSLVPVGGDDTAYAVVDPERGYLRALHIRSRHWAITDLVENEIGETVRDFTKAASMRGIVREGSRPPTPRPDERRFSVDEDDLAAALGADVTRTEG